MKKIIMLLLLVALFTDFLIAGSLEDDLKNFANESAKGYVKPLSYALNSGLDAGIFHSANALKPFRFSVFVNTSLILIPQKDRTFIAHRPEVTAMDKPVYEPETVETATIFGDKGSSFNVSADFMNASNVDNINLPDGINIGVMPFLSPQVNMGLPFHSEIGIRYFPLSVIDKEKFAKSYFLGLGLKNKLNLPLPVNISLFGYYQAVNIESIVNVNNLSVGVLVGKKLLSFDFYGSLFYSSGDMKVDYETTTVEYQPPNFVEVPIKINLDLKNSTLKPKFGLTYSFFLFKVNFEACYSRYPSYNLGLGVSLP